ncbi:hypothetical protein CEXT_245091 [Caerostris extrusa]|uniref:Uncharacterized protein n=1 Tax=Caerostris extrusa TaxID=172846 RepID=A0AAV4XFG9_CAEEX|nr:hypothetical protein CEXT_245091 [Caerostris extrusa]
MDESSAYKSLFLTVLTEMTIITSIPHKNDFHIVHPKHAVSILSNKKNTRLVLLNTPADLPKQPKDVASFKISPSDGVDNKPLNIVCCKTSNTFQRHPCRESSAIVRTRGEARAFGNTLLKLLANDFHYGG